MNFKGIVLILVFILVAMGMSQAKACETYRECSGSLCSGGNTYTLTVKNCRGDVVNSISRNFSHYQDCEVSRDRECYDEAPSPRSCEVYKECSGSMCSGGNTYTVKVKNCRGEQIDSFFRNFSHYKDCEVARDRECY